jgi:hypothetical protein
MKSRKELWMWIGALCLLSAALITISLKARPASVQAAGTANMQRVNRPTLPPVEEFTLIPPNSARNIYQTIVSVRFEGSQAEKLAAQVPLTLGSQNVVLQRSPDDARIFSTQVDFDWQTFAKEQQQRKDLAATGRQIPVFEGRRFVRMEKMQFVDPAEIQGALQSHQPVQFSGRVLAGGAVNVYPNRELMITDLSVVQDVGTNGNGRVYDSCIDPSDPTSPANGNPTGAWTLATLMMAMANTTNIQVAEQMLNTMLSAWQNEQTINGFTVQPRGGIGVLSQSGLLGNWPADPNNPSLPSLLNPPVRLNAIVNRIDLGQNFNPATAGELRFIFGVTAGTSPGGSCAADPKAPFDIIIEFNVPSTFSPNAWANLWNSLGTEPTNAPPGAFPAALQSKITDAVVTAGSCGGSSCLAQIRTTELDLAAGETTDFWEQREFHLGQDQFGNPVLQQSTVAMTPDGSFNFGQPKCGQTGMPGCTVPGTLVNYINTNQTEILDTLGALPFLPTDYPPGTPFLGGSAFNPDDNLGGKNGVAGAFWEDSTKTANLQARIYFSANTCNSCHGADTSTLFVHVQPRTTSQSSGLSGFLVGCLPGIDNCFTSKIECSLSTPNLACTEQVPDPTGSGTKTSFGDIGRRVVVLAGLVTNGPRSGGMLLPLVNQPIGVH